MGLFENLTYIKIIQIDNKRQFIQMSSVFDNDIENSVFEFYWNVETDLLFIPKFD